MSRSVGLVVTWAYLKCRWQEKAFPISPDLDPPLCSLQKGVTSSLWSVANYYWTVPKAQIQPYWWIDISRGQINDFLFYSHGKENWCWNSDGLLWKLTSKMVLEWVIPTLKWQIKKYKRKWYCRIQIHSPKWTCHNLFVWGQSFALILK